MSYYVEDALAIVGIIVSILLALAAILCCVGLLIQGDNIEVTPAGDGCYTITKTHTNWYPSSDKVLSRKLICEDK